jgi:quercetin dioxygenase-like cupin family protein
LNRESCAGAPVHIATHVVTGLAEAPQPYVDAHAHPACHEIGLVIGAPGALEYEIILDGKAHKVRSPGSVFIPAGTVHRARALRGSGAYVCILMDPQGPTDGNSIKPAQAPGS